MAPKATRNTSIEALRLVAVAGIAIFHTFQWTFQAVCTGVPEYATLAAFPYSGALGSINLMGCWANEVFFMISGYFLIPSAVRALQNGSSVHDLTCKSLARLKKIVFPTLFYCAACLLVSMFIYPLPEISLHEIGWLTLGIEFIWVYAASVLLVPIIVLARRRIGSKRAPFVAALLVLATFGINCYIAATANEAAGIALWRKLMSAVTYLVAFIAAGEMRFALDNGDKASDAQNPRSCLSDSLPSLSRSRFCYRQTASTPRFGCSLTSPLPSYPSSWPPHPLPQRHSINRVARPRPQARRSHLSPQERWASMPCNRLPAMFGVPSSTMQSMPWQPASRREHPIHPAPLCSESL